MAGKDTFGWKTREPCKTCPYRLDVPAGTWHLEEFQKLVENEVRSERGPAGVLYECHATKAAPQVCAGWLLDHKRTGPRSIPLRIALMADPAAREAWAQVTAAGAPMYASIEAMVLAQTKRHMKRPRTARTR